MLPAGEPLFSPLAGKIHSFANNAAEGDYGPTLIMEHEIQGQRFYILYGHLSRKSLLHYQEGKTIAAGELLGWLGTEDENGHWPAHLHLQFIQDLGDYRGDYPGVCSQKDALFFLQNCPNPEALLKPLLLQIYS